MREIDLARSRLVGEVGITNIFSGKIYVITHNPELFDKDLNERLIQRGYEKSFFLNCFPEDELGPVEVDLNERAGDYLVTFANWSRTQTSSSHASKIIERITPLSLHSTARFEHSDSLLWYAKASRMKFDPDQAEKKMKYWEDKEVLSNFALKLI